MGLEKVSFHSIPKERQCQRLLKLPHNCTHGLQVNSIYCNPIKITIYCVCQSLIHVRLFVTPSRLLCPWDFSGKNTGVVCHFLLQGIFPTQGSNWSLLHWQLDFYHWATWECPLHVKHYRNISSGPKNSRVKAIIFLSTLQLSKVRDLWKLNNFSHSHIASKWQSWDSNLVWIRSSFHYQMEPFDNGSLLS